MKIIIPNTRTESQLNLHTARQEETQVKIATKADMSDAKEVEENRPQW